MKPGFNQQRPGCQSGRVELLCWENLNTHVSGIMRTLLQANQDWPALIDGFLAQTGLSLEPEPP